MRAQRWLLAVVGVLVAAVVALAVSPETRTVTHRVTVTAPAFSVQAQIEACKSTVAVEPPCSAIHPEGSSGLLATYVEGPLPFALTGSAVRVDTFGAEQTAAFENVRKAWYCPEPDPAYGWGIPTRAFGETGRGITRGSPCISYSTAVRNLRYLLDADYCPAVRDTGVNLSQRQVDALCDLAYNVGPGVICCTLTADLRTHAFSAAAVYIRRYSYANGEFLSGLYTRRVDEGRWLQQLEKPKPPHRLTTRERAGVKRRIHTLERVLTADGCIRRERQHQRLGDRCKRWSKELAGNQRALKVGHF